uniref:Uncharacterized protein n=1 Tax=Setaria italica TaxID=4555 RepID=K3Y2N0_SETIT
MRPREQAKWQPLSAEAYVQALKIIQLAAQGSDQLPLSACLSNKCRSSQHHLGIGLRLITRAIHGRRCMQSSLPKPQHNRKEK